MSQNPTVVNGYNVPRLITEQGLLAFYAAIPIEVIEHYLDRKMENELRRFPLRRITDEKKYAEDIVMRYAETLIAVTKLIAGNPSTTSGHCTTLNSCYFNWKELHLQSRYNLEKDDNQQVLRKYMKADDHIRSTLGHIFDRENVDPDNFTHQQFSIMLSTMIIKQ